MCCLPCPDTFSPAHRFAAPALATSAGGGRAGGNLAKGEPRERRGAGGAARRAGRSRRFPARPPRRTVRSASAGESRAAATVTPRRTWARAGRTSWAARRAGHGQGESAAETPAGLRRAGSQRGRGEAAAGGRPTPLSSSGGPPVAGRPLCVPPRSRTGPGAAGAERSALDASGRRAGAGLNPRGWEKGGGREGKQKGRKGEIFVLRRCRSTC